MAASLSLSEVSLAPLLWPAPSLACKESALSAACSSFFSSILYSMFGFILFALPPLVLLCWFWAMFTLGKFIWLSSLLPWASASKLLGEESSRMMAELCEDPGLPEFNKLLLHWFRNYGCREGGGSLMAPGSSFDI